MLHHMVKYHDGLDGVANAMAHAGRRHIVDRLNAGPATTSELATLLDSGLPATMKQLTVLIDAGVVRRTKTGRTVRHELEAAPLIDYSTWLGARRSFWHGQLAALEAAVTRHD
jgi:DNA-binding transcriptional ArsR family regulator